MKKEHFNYYYNNVLNGEEQRHCNNITHGEDFDNLTLNQQIKLSIICIPDSINFFNNEDGRKLEFNTTTPEYKELESMDDEQWEVYLDIMEGRGITVEFDLVEDIFVVY